MNGEVQLAVLLAAGHLVSDFFVQTTTVAHQKKKLSILLRHGAETYLTHLIILWPFWSWTVVASVAVVAVLHMVTDAWKARAKPGVTNFLIDQGLHFLALAGCWVFLVAQPSFNEGLTNAARFGVGHYTWQNIENQYTWLILLAGMLAFNLRGGSILVRGALESTGSSLSNQRDGAGLGKMIGYLERLLVMVSVIAGQWSLIGLVMAAKSIARFSKLNEKDFAEYYLVGTLMSILVAVLTGAVALWAKELCLFLR